MIDDWRLCVFCVTRSCEREIRDQNPEHSHRALHTQYPTPHTLHLTKVLYIDSMPSHTTFADCTVYGRTDMDGWMDGFYGRVVVLIQWFLEI